jgi:hypothetical protein
MNISFKTKILYNGQEFSSVEQLPSEIRAIYKRALANRPNKLASTGTKVLTRLVVNGHEVGLTKELSEAEQKIYADAMQLVKDSATNRFGGNGSAVGDDFKAVAGNLECVGKDASISADRDRLAHG